jgi:ComF family protein
MWEMLESFFFPPHCPRCGAYVERRGGWCPACLRQAAHFTRLALPAGSPLMSAWAAGSYRGGLQNLIRGLKYHGKKSGLPYILTVLQRVPEPFPVSVALAVPVPLHPAKERQRGFNQTELIFRDWLALRDIPMRRLLVRTRPTPPQYGLTRQARQENLRGAFALAAGAAAELHGRDVLLLDDIFPTGTTAAACARVLLRGGVRSVSALVLASDHQSG